MSKNKRRRGRRRARAKRGNWFTRMKMWKRVLLILGCVLLCVIFGAVAYVYAKWSKIDTQEIKAEDLIINEEVKKNKEVDLGEGYTNVALFGVDSRDGNLGEGNRTDCIIVASLNNETKEIKMVSVYRDTLLDLSEGTYQKCNAAYSYGGPVMAINMLNMNLDLDIEDYVTVDFGAIADTIDLLGGVEIEVTEEELPYINNYIPETAKSAVKTPKLLESAGLQLLDGTQATTYARIRSTAGGDFTRTERQRLVIEKMFEKAKQADLKTLNAIIDRVFPQVSTSFTLTEILNYASAYSEYTLVGNMGFPQDNYTDMLSEIGSVVVPDDLVSNVTKLHEFLFGTTGYTPSSTVQTVSSNITYTANTTQSSSEETYDDGSVDDGSYDDSGAGTTYDEIYVDPGTDTGETPESTPPAEPTVPPETTPDPGGDPGSGTDPGTDPGTGEQTGT
ncbi:LCP family protein [Clostridium sp. Marseille-P3244]|uniref:LCP family protein n=1 Tax=Clostridium sp. Marseille-P3244 TaxID=1871020 RepID=UPI0009312D5A|nr:LCP family protein [Clostridium sp. Marseille-P3244]